MKLKGALIILIWLGVSFLSSCARYQQKAFSNPAKKDNLAKEDSPPDIENKVSNIITAAEEYYAAGEVAYQMGHLKKARHYFDKSIDTILSSGIDMTATAELKEKYLQFVEEIYAKEMEWLQQGDGFTETRTEPALIDELAEVNLNSESSEVLRSSEAIKGSTETVSYDIPIVVNKYVLACIELFKNERRKEIEAGLKRSGKYLSMIKEVFRQEGVPQDLAYMALVESCYKPHALSRARAKGIWQFIKSTGKLYGLNVNWWVDERSDPEKATRAAARHLKDLYQQFGDWYLVMASYNGGANRVTRAIKRLKTKDFWRILKTRYIRRETKNYVPAVLAAIIISKNPHSFGFNVNIDEPIKYDKVKLKSCTDLRVIAECSQTSIKKIIELNPELRRLMTPVGYKNYEIKIPAGTKEKFLKALSSIPESKRIAWRKHIVRSGESLSQIATRYRTSINAICQANNIRNKHFIRAGRSLLIPIGPVGGRYYSVWRAPKARYTRNYKKGQRIDYRVRKGDSLYKIALRYGTNVASIKKWNKITSDILHPGKKIVIWAGTVVSDGSTSLRRKQAKEPIIYRVKLGDTLYDIAKEFNTSIKEICRWNSLSAKQKIFPGDKLKIYPK